VVTEEHPFPPIEPHAVLVGRHCIGEARGRLDQRGSAAVADPGCDGALAGDDDRSRHARSQVIDVFT
jgi:hypothetical protein